MENVCPEIKELSPQAKPEVMAFQINSCLNSVFLSQTKMKEPVFILNSDHSG